MFENYDLEWNPCRIRDRNMRLGLRHLYCFNVVSGLFYFLLYVLLDVYPHAYPLPGVKCVHFSYVLSLPVCFSISALAFSLQIKLNSILHRTLSTVLQSQGPVRAWPSAAQVGLRCAALLEWFLSQDRYEEVFFSKLVPAYI